MDIIIRDIAGIGSGGSGNSDVIQNADKNAQDIIQNQNQGNQEIKDNADKNAQEIQDNQNQNTDKITDKLEDTKKGIIAGLIDGIKGLFLPSDGYFTEVFNRLNNFFKERFGFLYTPIDLLIRFCELIVDTDSSFAGIPIPEISWEGTTLISAQTVSLSFQGAAFQDLQKKLYFVTNLIMIGALLSLMHRKFEEVMRR